MKEEFLTHVKDMAGEFLELVENSSAPVKIIGNLDTDGITSTSILCKAFARKGIPYSTAIVKQVNSELIESLQNETFEILVFADLATAFIQELAETIDKPIFVLDHHFPETNEKRVGKLRQINPHFFSIDGQKEISAAGISYFFAKSISESNSDLAYLALVGAIGDMQENMGFIGMNKLILDDAIARDMVEMRETLRIFGIQTKPIHKVLEYSTNPYIPGVTGNERSAIKFIEDAGIDVYDKARNFKKLVSLSKEELEKLVNAIEIKKTPGTGMDILVGPVFLLKNEEDDSFRKDLREFSTLLNSCGRMGSPSLGVGVCLDDPYSCKKAYDILRRYRKEIIDALNWFYNNRRSEKIIEKNGYVVILAESNIRDTIIGTLASLLAKSNVYPEETIILSSSYCLDGMIKLSLRASGNKTDVDLRAIVKDIIADGPGYGGGHKLAAGASIPQDREDSFIRNALASLDKYTSGSPKA